MITFYQAPCARITDQVFEVRCPIQQRFAIDELTNVHAREVDLPLPGWLLRPRVCSSTLAAVAVAVLASGWPPPAQLLTLAITVPLVLIAALAISSLRSRQTSVYELTALYQGRRITLYRCTDSRVFERVSRALLRALDDGDT